LQLSSPSAQLVVCGPDRCALRPSASIPCLVLRFSVGPYSLNCSLVFQTLDLFGHSEMKRFIAHLKLWIAGPPSPAIRSHRLCLEWERSTRRPLVPFKVERRCEMGPKPLWRPFRCGQRAKSKDQDQANFTLGRILCFGFRTASPPSFADAYGVQGGAMAEPPSRVDRRQVGEPVDPIQQRLAVSNRRDQLARPSPWRPPQIADQIEQRPSVARREVSHKHMIIGAREFPTSLFVQLQRLAAPAVGRVRQFFAHARTSRAPIV